jgi:hypothetical protein
VRVGGWRGVEGGGYPPRRASDSSRLVRQVIGVVEKETGFRSFGSWQLVTWNRRFLFTTPEALCYRHVNGRQKPTGRTTPIAFSSIQRVGVHADGATSPDLAAASL